MIDSQDVTCSELSVRAPRAVIKNSKLRSVDVHYQYPTASATIKDSVVDLGQVSACTVNGHDFTILRSEILGGQHSVCADNNVTVIDSWLHGQWNDPNASNHINAFISNGGSNFTVRHNTLHCDVTPNSHDGGCSGELDFFGDTGPISNAVLENNLLKANPGISYCSYAGHLPGKPYPNATGMQYRNNVWERGTNGKCGAFGPVSGFDPNAAGNVWSGNVWSDGSALSPAT